MVVIPEHVWVEAQALHDLDALVHAGTRCPIWTFYWSNKRLLHWQVYDGTNSVSCPWCLREGYLGQLSKGPTCPRCRGQVESYGSR